MCQISSMSSYNIYTYIKMFILLLWKFKKVFMFGVVF